MIDVGGTSTDIGILTKGFPRLSAVEIHLAGVRANFRMPDVASLGLGGGSIVTVDESKRTVRVGPSSVGYELNTKARIFGGNVLTATDVAVSLGLVQLGDSSKVSDVPDWVKEEFQKEIRMRVEECMDTMRLTDDDVDVVLVGGGIFLIPDALRGVKKIHRPADFFAVANALGASTAQVHSSPSLKDSYAQSRFFIRLGIWFRGLHSFDGKSRTSRSSRRGEGQGHRPLSWRRPVKDRSARD